jgi:hypothetical protein
MKYGISTDTLLRYLAFLADQHDAGISLTTIHFEGQTIPLSRGHPNGGDSKWITHAHHAEGQAGGYPLRG